jgi:hypothetical protein
VALIAPIESICSIEPEGELVGSYLYSEMGDTTLDIALLLVLYISLLSLLLFPVPWPPMCAVVFVSLVVVSLGIDEWAVFGRLMGDACCLNFHKRSAPLAIIDFFLVSISTSLCNRIDVAV